MDSTLTRSQFRILEALESSGTLSQDDYHSDDFKAMCDTGMITEGGKLLREGYMALEPYIAKRATFIAAGFGSRLVPITLNTPKPLVRVNGTRIIDTLIDAVLSAGINEIYIVRGYLAEQFDQLLYKYPMLKFIENPAYNEANNISSAMCVRYLLSNAYVIESDLLLRNPKLIRKYNYTSNFLGIKKARFDDWCFTVNDDGIITAHAVGGLDCWQEVGISYWNDYDGRKLSEHIRLAYDMPGGKEKYWEQIPLSVFLEEYKVEIRECSESDVVEIDTWRELKVIDGAYNV